MNPAQNGNGTPPKSIVDIFLSLGKINETDAQKIKATEIQTGKSQEDIILDLGLANTLEMAKVKAQFYKIEFLILADIPVSPEALALLSRDVAKRLMVFPVAVDKTAHTLKVAMANPLDINSIEFIEKKTKYKVIPLWSDINEINEFISTKYSASINEEVASAMEEVGETIPGNFQETLATSGFIKDEKIAEIVSHILEFAIRGRASDIHIEPQEGLTRVRYRIDGILWEKLTIPRNLHDALISRIKILSGMKIDERRVPQDGRFAFRAMNEDIDLRVSSLPTTWGEKIVMRLLKKSGGVPEVMELGLRGSALKALNDAILRPHGIILVCGPTGSGKTTTLYSVISKINTSKVNVVSLEDPIEYKIAGVNQVQINPGAGLTFAFGLRSFLRQDPNIIYVGEIRDQETVDLAIQASLTGHLVFSTLHTNNASGALPRLLDMGAEPYLLESSITAIVAQRVVRQIHTECREEYVPEPAVVEEMIKVLGPMAPKDGIKKLYRGRGDNDCGSSGYYGRMGIFEVLPVNEKIGKLILTRASSKQIEVEAVAMGMTTMKQDGYLKCIEGITTVEEVLRVAEE